MSFLQHDDEAVAVAPDLHKVVFEDGKLRVLEVTVPVGATARMHWHPRNINYIQSGGTLRFIRENGTTADLELSVGQVTSSDAASHTVENIGDSEVRTVQIEFKD